MFAYLIITCELAILYTVFWYIFLREPKPFRVAESIWGRYDNGMKFTGNQIDPTLPIQTREDWMSLNENLYGDYCGNRSRMQFKHGFSAARLGLPKIDRSPTVKHGWVLEENEPQDKTSWILDSLRRTFEELRLRMSY